MFTGASRLSCNAPDLVILAEHQRLTVSYRFELWWAGAERHPARESGIEANSGLVRDGIGMGWQ
jgi:hypothetical protein